MLIFYGIMFWIYVILSALDGFEDTEKSKDNLKVAVILLSLWVAVRTGIDLFAAFSNSPTEETSVTQEEPAVMEEIQDVSPAG